MRETAATEGASVRATERRDAASIGLDAADDVAVLSTLYAGQVRALAAVEAAIPALAQVAALAVTRLEVGGRLIYLAAGSPGLIALNDALEIPQTYGEPKERFLALMAGGEAMTRELLGGPEDDGDAARRDLAAIGVGAADCVVGVSASGSTRYTVAGLAAARGAGAATAAIANNPEAPMFAGADVAVLLDSGPEVVAGSTRMGAGTAQKAALNMLSTLVATRLGHVHDGHMVSLRADNDKLRARAERMVAEIAGVDAPGAAEALAAAGGEVKAAVLVAAGVEPADAAALVAGYGGHLRRALSAAQNRTALAGR